jgi:hypothetical protein
LKHYWLDLRFVHIRVNIGMKILSQRRDRRKTVINDVAVATWAVLELSGSLALGAVPGTNAAIGGAIASAAVGSYILVNYLIN